MKKYIVIILVSLVIGGTSVYASQKLNLIWELSQTSGDENLKTKFYSNDHVKVFKFTDDLGSRGIVHCYVSVSPKLDAGYTPAGYSKSVDGLQTSISCVK